MADYSVVKSLATLENEQYTADPVVAWDRISVEAIEDIGYNPL